MLYITVIKVTSLVGDVKGYACTRDYHLLLHGLVLLPYVQYHVRTINRFYKLYKIFMIPLKVVFCFNYLNSEFYFDNLTAYD